MNSVVHELDRESREPERTCAGCRTQEPQGALVRVVLGPDGSVAVDHPRRMGGRGAYLHCVRRCVREAVKRGALARAFKVKGLDVSADELVDAMRARFTERAISLLAAARKSNRAEAGASTVTAALREGRVALLVSAVDSAAGRHEVDSALRAVQSKPREVKFGTKEELGAIWGRDVLGVIAVIDSGLGEAIAAEVERLEPLVSSVGEGTG